MRKFRALTTNTVKSDIEPRAIANLMEQGIDELLGCDRYIDEKGDVMERDYRYDQGSYVRKATKEEIEIFNALRLLEKYFSS